jgi:uncharacterized protein with gpF-like domain
MTINEKREATGLAKLDSDAGGSIITNRGVIITPDGDVLGPGTTMPLPMDGEMPEPPTPAPAPAAPPAKEIEPKFKAFNLSTVEEQVAHGKAFDHDRGQFFERWDLRFAGRLREEKRHIVEAISKQSTVAGMEEALDKVLKADYKQWERDYDDLYMEVGEHFARRTIRSLPKGLEVPNPKMLEKAMLLSDWKQDDEDEDIFVFKPFRDSMRTYVAEISATRIVGIDNVTRKRVRDQLLKGTNAGEDVRQISNRIDGYLDDIYPNRAETVARTEVINASNAGAHQGAKMVGVARTKTWLAIEDTRTRNSHHPQPFGVGGQVKKFDEPFVIPPSNVKLMWPGDSSLGAGADEVINCRCTQIYST